MLSPSSVFMFLASLSTFCINCGSFFFFEDERQNEIASARNLYQTNEYRERQEHEDNCQHCRMTFWTRISLPWCKWPLSLVKCFSSSFDLIAKSNHSFSGFLDVRFISLKPCVTPDGFEAKDYSSVSACAEGISQRPFAYRPVLKEGVLDNVLHAGAGVKWFLSYPSSIFPTFWWLNSV